MVNVYLIVLFFRYSSAHPGKIISYCKHKISFNGSVVALLDNVARSCSVKAHILIKQVISPEFQFQVIPFKKGFNQECIDVCLMEICRERFCF